MSAISLGYRCDISLFPLRCLFFKRAISRLHRCNESFSSGHLCYRCEISSSPVMSLRYRCQIYRDTSLLMLRYLSSIRYRSDISFIAAISSPHRRHRGIEWQCDSSATSRARYYLAIPPCDIAATLPPCRSYLGKLPNNLLPPPVPRIQLQSLTSLPRQQPTGLTPYTQQNLTSATSYPETRYIGPSDRLSRCCDSLIFVG